MRKLLSAVTAAALLAVTPLAAGCGADDLSPEDVASAAEATRDEKSARVAMQLTASGFGSPVPLAVQGKGVTALQGAQMDLTLELGPLLALAGVEGDGATRLVVRGKDVYVKPPAVRQLELPGGADWVGLDLAKVGTALGIDAKAMASVVNADPGAQLEALTSAKGVKKVGEEKIGGEDTTHFRGEVRIGDLIAGLPADQREAARQALEQLDRAGGGTSADVPQRMDVWVDGEKRIRRMRQEIRTPAQGGLAAGRIGMRIDFSDFGTPLRIAAPPAGETFDATSRLSELFAAAVPGVTR